MQQAIPFKPTKVSRARHIGPRQKHTNSRHNVVQLVKRILTRKDNQDKITNVLIELLTDTLVQIQDELAQFGIEYNLEDEKDVLYRNDEVQRIVTIFLASHAKEIFSFNGRHSTNLKSHQISLLQTKVRG